MCGILFLISARTFSQERYGISNSMYAGITGSWLNPAFIASSPYRWDFNIVTLHSYLDNNYVYVFQTNVPDYVADNGNTKLVVNNAWDRYQGKSSKYMLENKEKNNWRKNIYENTLIQGPSLMFNFKKWTFGVITDGRAAVSLTRLHKTCAKLAFEGLTYDPLQNIDIDVPKFRLNGMVWDEIGISVAREIIKDRDMTIKAGVTLKHLNAFAGAYLLHKKSTLYVPNDSDLFFKNVDAKYGYALNQEDGKFLTSTGKGISMDIGVTFEKKTLKNSYQCPNFCNKKLELQYNWKLGISLIDIGYVRFKEKAQTFSIDNKSNYWFNFSNLKIDDLGGFDSTLSQHFDGNPVPTVTGTNFTMLTPWAASVQFDYNVGYNVFVNATWVQRIPHFGLPGVDRANTIAITPHYELRRFGVAMPIIMYQYLWPRIGLAFRLNNFLFVGTDKLGALIGHRLSGADIYVGLKINVLRKCNKRKSKSFLAF